MRTTDNRIQFIGVALILAGSETILISVLVLPYESTRADWLLTTLLAAPLATLATLLLIMLPLRVAADIAHFAKGAVRLFTKNRT